MITFDEFITRDDDIAALTEDLRFFVSKWLSISERPQCIIEKTGNCNSAQ